MTEKNRKSVGFFGLFAYATKLDIFMTVLGITFGIIGGGIFPLISHCFGKEIEAFIKLEKTNDTAPFVRDVRLYSCILLGCGGVIFILCYLTTIVMCYAASNQSRTIQLRFFRAALSQDLSWYDQNTSKDFAVKMTTDLGRVQEGIGDRLGITVFLLAVSVSTSIAAFCYHWRLAGIVYFLVPVICTCFWIISWLQGKVSSRETQTYGEAGAVAEEVLSAVKTVFAFGGEAKENKRYSKKVGETKKWAVRRGILSGATQGVTWFFGFAAYAITFFVGMIFFGKGEITEAEMTTVFFNIVFAFFYATQIAPYFEAYNSATAAALEIYEAIERKPLIDNFSKTGKEIKDCAGKLEFTDVHFHYPTRPNTEILQGLTLTIEPGETVALTGPSGSGKSTCLQLLLRYYDPQDGTVSLDGQDIKSLNVGSYRNLIAVVGQEPTLFSMSILENIRMGKPSATMEEVVKASQDAGAHTFISKMPERYNTVIGERGGQLSGGQKQRIAIARALVKNPKILILDEATSALDMQSERMVQEALERACKGRTTVIVAHRLSTIQNADKIVVLEKGVVKEIGRHDELLAQGGIYYELVSHQQQGDLDMPVDVIPQQPSNDVLSVDSSNLTSSLTVTGKPSTVPRGKFSVLKKILGMVKEHPFALSVGCFGACFMGLTFPMYGFLFGELIGVFDKKWPGIVKQNELNDKRFEETQRFCGYFLVLAISSAIASFVQIYAFSIIGESITLKLRQQCFDAYLRQDMAYFDNPQNGVGALCSRLASDTTDVQGIGGVKVSVVLQAIFCTVGITVLAFAESWQIGLIVLGFVPVLLAGESFEQIVMVRQAVKATALKEASAKVAIEALSSMKTIISLRAEEAFYTRFEKELAKQYHKIHCRVHVHAVVMALSQSAFILCYGTCIWYGSYLRLHTGMAYKNLFKIMEGVVFSTELMGQALALSSDILKGTIAARNIFALVERRPLIDSSKEIGNVKDNLTGHIKFDNVYFSYPTRRKTRVLRGLTYEIQPGQSVALVGESGCGKSTSIQLLERYYNTDKGALLIDDVDVKQLNVPWLRSKIGLVQQEPILFSYSVGENIAYGDNERVVPQAEIIEAAKKANAHTFIESLPKGYETDVGDKGSQLSGGQKQRIAIARALIRNPAILLLDEATSALDAQSEKIVQEALDHAMKGRTTVIIAHRLKTIENVDKIVVLKRGTVVEEGTHKELLSTGGQYYKLWNAQK